MRSEEQISMLRFLRELAGLSREDLSAQMGHRFSLSTWSRWENGPKEPIMTRREWQEFCEIVGVPIERLPLDLSEMGTKEILSIRLCAPQQVSETFAGAGKPFNSSSSTPDNRQETASLALMRQRIGISQEKFASQLAKRFRDAGSPRKLTKTTVSDWERGRSAPKLTPVEMLEMARYLQCSLEELALATRESSQS